MKGYNNEEASFFGKVPYFPDDNGNELPIIEDGNEPINISGYCTTIAVRTEWFIAYARRNALTKDDFARAKILKKSLAAVKICKKIGESINQDDSCIDDAHRDRLISVLDAIINEHSSCN